MINKAIDDEELRRNAQEYIARKRELRGKNNISIIIWGVVYILILYGWMIIYQCLKW